MRRQAGCPTTGLQAVSEQLPTDLVGVTCQREVARELSRSFAPPAAVHAFEHLTGLRMEEAPPELLDTAVRAASLFGDGLFGVDVKVVDGRLMVMEVNDNPNLEAGYEDALLKDTIYDEIAVWFRARLDRRGERPSL